MPNQTQYRIVLLRHGQSIWNLENRFTGWTDVDLTEQGISEAREAGKLLQKEGYQFDLAFTSVLKRANRTLELVLETMGLSQIPVIQSWRLNERHYGALQGLNKLETAEKYGEDQVQIWRRSYATPPPALTTDDERFPGRDPMYLELDPQEIPLCESLRDTIERFLPYWENQIVPEIREGKQIIIAAHGNSLRALVKILDRVSETEITELNIPTGIPLVYELDSNLRPVRHYYLGDADAAEKAAQAVAAQSKKS